MGRPSKPKSTPAAATAAADPANDGLIAASFGFESMGPAGGGFGPGVPALISRQKFRNNWFRIPQVQQMRACRALAAVNEFVTPILTRRWMCLQGGFRIAGERAATRFFKPIVADLLWEHLVMDNCVLLFRRGEPEPVVTTLDCERVVYEVVAGRQRIRLLAGSGHANIGLTNQDRQTLLDSIGKEMYGVFFGGREMILWEDDEEWGFVVSTLGKRGAGFRTPSLVPLLDVVDYLTLMGVGDWNLAWFRKDVIRQIKKGYKVTGGQGAGLDSVNITPNEVQQLGEGFKRVSGNTNIPTNHDVDLGYVLVPPEAFDEAQVAGAVKRLLTWGGIEAVALFGNFSQQNGAAASLMRNAQVEAAYRRSVAVDLVQQLLDQPEFSVLLKKEPDIDKLVFCWSNTGLFSVDELKTLSATLGGGVASPQTVRELWGLDDEIESARMRESQADPDAYIPVFEAKQGLVAAHFTAIYPAKPSVPGGSGGGDGPADGGRPTGSAASNA
jgi:hypothetical protein